MGGGRFANIGGGYDRGGGAYIGEGDMAGDGQTSRRWRTIIRPQFRAECAAQDLPCWLCGQGIDYGLADPYDDNVWEPDHMYPRSTHREFAEDPGNLRPSHRKCNRVRSNTKHTNLHGLGNQSKSWW